jgi:hypothetical protein
MQPHSTIDQLGSWSLVGYVAVYALATVMWVPGAIFGLLFHVIVDDFHRTFSIDGPGGPNGVRLHYEMLQAARAEKKKLRDFDLRADSHEAALAEMQTHFPGYQFLGNWASS